MPLWKKKKPAEPAAPLDILRWKITALNVFFAVMVVATLCCVAFKQGKNALEEKHRLMFSSLCTALEEPILETQTIDHKAIYSSAVEHRLIPALFEKGAPIENPYLSGISASRLLALSETALEKARQNVSGQNGVWAKTVVRQDYTVQDGSSLWFAEYCAIPTPRGEWIEIYLFQDAVEFRQEWHRLRLLYLAVSLGGVLLLGAMSFALAGWAMQPARQAEQMEREFLAAASHELKSPLAVIITSAELLAPGDGEAAKCRTNILSEARRMALMVQQLLSLSRLETASRRVLLAEVDTEAFLWEVYETYQPVAAKANDRLTLRLPDGALPPIRADEDALKQVLSILLSNAVQHTPGGTKIELSAAPMGRTVCLTVADTGPGIADKERAFQKFYRAEPQNSDASLGLGLSIAQKIVALHHGSITIRDTPGGGATLQVTIPQA